jgi:hypothetical protein
MTKGGESGRTGLEIRFLQEQEQKRAEGLQGLSGAP